MKLLFTKKLLAVFLSLVMIFSVVPAMTVLAAGEFTLTYELNGGIGSYPPKSFASAVNTLVNSVAPTKVDHKFIGWADTEDGTGNIYQPGKLIYVNAPITLYAIWVEVQEISLSYDLNGGTSTTPAKKIFNTATNTITAPAPTKPSDEFLYWADVSAGINYASGKLILVDRKIELVAIWRDNLYNVTYWINDGGSGQTYSNSYAYGTPVTVRPSNTFSRTGFTFVGWSTDRYATVADQSFIPGSTFSMPNKNIVLFAVWSENEYSLIYDGNGNTGGTSPIEVKYTHNQNATIMGCGDLVKEGWTFLGWSTDVNATTADAFYTPGFSRAITADLTLYAVWSENTYTITYIGYNQTAGVAPVDSGSYLHNDLAYIEDQGFLVRDGYTFAGWATSGYITIYTAGQEVSMTESLVLYSIWTQDEYTLSYDGNGNTGGTAPVEAQYTHNQNATISGCGDLVKEGWTFLGWSIDVNATTADAFYTPGYSRVITADLTLYAVWSENTYTITYIGYNQTAGAAPVDNGSYVHNDLAYIEGQGSLVRDGYTFAGWATSGYLAIYTAGQEVSMTESLVLYSIWTQDEYELSYDGNGNTGGTAPAGGTGYTWNTSIAVADQGTLVRDGWTFAGWKTSASGTVAEYDNGDTLWIKETTTLFAHWKQNTYTITYHRYNAVDGSAPVDSNVYVYNDPADIMGQGTLVKDGWTFVGWGTSGGFGVTHSGSIQVTESLDLYDIWVINEYTVTFLDWDGTELKTETVEHGMDATPPVVLGSDNWEFDYWDKDYTNITGDLTVTVVYKMTYEYAKSVLLDKIWEVALLYETFNLPAIVNGQSVYINTAASMVDILDAINQLDILILKHELLVKIWAAAELSLWNFGLPAIVNGQNVFVDPLATLYEVNEAIRELDILIGSLS